MVRTGEAGDQHLEQRVGWMAVWVARWWMGRWMDGALLPSFIRIVGNEARKLEKPRGGHRTA